MDKKINKSNHQKFLKAFNKLTPEAIEARYMPLVKSVASKYKGAKIEAGIKGLYHAINLYVLHERNERFEIYASWFIREEIEKSLPFLQRLGLAPYRAWRWLDHLFWKQSQKRTGKT